MMTDAPQVLLGDSGVQCGAPPPNVHVLAKQHAMLAEVVSLQLPLSVGLTPSSITLTPGARDILDGYDESYIHAQLVELLDAIQRAHPGVPVEIHGFPLMTDTRLDFIRRQCDGSARAAAEQRGMTWRPKHINQTGKS